MGLKHLATVVGTAALLSPAASALSAEPHSERALPARYERMAKECLRQRQPGVLRSAFRPAELRSLLRYLERSKAKYTRCWTAANSQLSGLTGRAGRSDMIIDDCLRHRGTLTRRYGRTALKRTVTDATPELRDETRCLAAVVSQLNGLRAAHEAPARAPERRPEQPIVDGAQLITTRSIFRQSKADEDAPPRDAFDAIPKEYAADLETTRQVRALRGMRLYVAPVNVGACFILDFSPSGGKFTNVCGAVGQLSAGLAVVPNGYLVAALLPDGTRDVKVVDHWAKWRNAPLTQGVLARVYRRPPSLVSATGSDGRTHYRDLNFFW